MLRTLAIRGILILILAACGAFLWIAQTWVRPEAVRATVLESFQEQFPEAHVTLAEAHLRVFGGVSVRELSIARSGDAEPFFRAPTATIAHDKEALSSGRMVIRKIELDGATLKLERRADGRWSFDGLTRPSPADKPMPMFVVQRGSITLTDKSQSGLPPLVFSEASFELINDPPPLFLKVKGTAMLTAAGTAMTPVKVDLHGRIHRLTGEFSFRILATDVAIGPDLAALVAAWQPEAAKTLRQVNAKACLRADLSYRPDAVTPLQYDVEAVVREGSFRDPRLPLPVEGLSATLRLKDGKLAVEKATAKLGTSTAEVSLQTRPPPPLVKNTPGTLVSIGKSKDPFAELEDRLESFDLTLKDLALTDELFGRLGSTMQAVRQRFNPAGVVTVSYHFSRPAPHSWRRDFELKPTRFGLMYEKFRYPLSDVTGSIRTKMTSSGGEDSTIDLTASAGGQRIEIVGTVSGGGDDPAIDLKIAGNNVAIDDRLCQAFVKPRHQQTMRNLKAVGRADIVAEVKQHAGVNLTECAVRVKVLDATICPTQFPYAMNSVSGLIAVNVASTDTRRPIKPGVASLPDTDRITLSDFTAKHGPGLITFKGESFTPPNEADGRIRLHASGQNCPVNADLRAALAAIKIDGVWTTFNPRGAMTFAVDVDIVDRVAAVPAPLPPPFDPNTPPGLKGTLTARPKNVPVEGTPPPFNPATDLVMTLHFAGPSVTPDFFPYDLDQLSGRVKYDGTLVRVEKFAAKHGESAWALDAGEVRFFKDGRVWANIGRLDVTPVKVDDAFLKALPPGLMSGVRQLNLKGNAELVLNHLVVLTPPDAPKLLPPIKTVSAEDAKKLGQVLDGTQDANQFAALNSNEFTSWQISHRNDIPLSTKKNPAITPDPDIYWTGELKLNGASLDAGVEWTNLMGRVASTGRYYGTHLGEVTGNLWLDDATAMQQPFKNLKLSYRADPQVANTARPDGFDPVAVKFADIQGTLFGGSIGGEARLILDAPVKYRLRLDATDINLGDLARHHGMNDKGSIEGLGQASLRLETRLVPHSQKNANNPLPDEVISGAGTFDVDKAKLLNLPFLLPLLKTLKLQAPDKTAFEEAHADFKIDGDRITVTHLDLLGDAISIGGSGELDTAGKYVKLECYTILSQTLHRWLTTPFGDLSAFISGNLFRIDILRGDDGQMKYDARLLPALTDPVRNVAERMKKRKQR